MKWRRGSIVVPGRCLHTDIRTSELCIIHRNDLYFSALTGIKQNLKQLGFEESGLHHISK